MRDFLVVSLAACRADVSGAGVTPEMGSAMIQCEFYQRAGALIKSRDELNAPLRTKSSTMPRHVKIQ